VFLLFTLNTSAQSQEKIYAVMLLNFARGIQWPQHVVADHFTIGVFQYPPLHTELNQVMANIKIDNKPVKIIDLSSTTEIPKCQVIFIPAFKSKVLIKALADYDTQSILFITNAIGSAKKGSGINFILSDGKLKYEINSVSIERRGLKISSTVRRLGVEVE
jgi:hypothetical protein